MCISFRDSEQWFPCMYTRKNAQAAQAGQTTATLTRPTLVYLNDHQWRRDIFRSDLKHYVSSAHPPQTGTISPTCFCLSTTHRDKSMGCLWATPQTTVLMLVHQSSSPPSYPFPIPDAVRPYSLGRPWSDSTIAAFRWPDAGFWSSRWQRL